MARAQGSESKAGERVYIGILDDAREEMVNWKSGVAQHRVIRPAFAETLTGWNVASSSSLPSQMSWTIAFDGRNLGQVKAQGPLNQGLTLFQSILTPAAAVPSVGSPSRDFAGIMGLTTKVRRPLVVVSQPYFRDPDGWKRATVPGRAAELVRNAFRNEYPHVDRCKDEEITERNWRFPDAALTFPVAYASNKGSWLVETRLNAGDCGWVDNPGDPLSDPWFYVSPNGDVRRIGSFMSLLDTGDYGDDGRSELIFFLSQGEDTDGFVLFDSTLQKWVDFTWHYH
jgi:hypothetical protein